MLSIIRKTFLTLTVLGAVLGTSPSWALDDGIIAIVNEDVITLKDLKDYIGSVYRQMKAEGKSEEEIKAAMADLEERGIYQIIDDKIVLDAARKKGLEIREAAIDDKVDEVRKKYISEKEFVDALLVDGATVGEFRNKVKEQMLVHYFIEMEVKSKIFVNPQEITDYYQKNPAQFLRPSRVNLDSIFVPMKDNPKEALAKAKEALKLLKEGTDFAEVAQKYSASPSLGIITKGEMIAEIDKAAFQLQVDQISDIIATEEGIFILKLKGKLPEETVPLEQAKKEIQSLLFMQKFKVRYQQWMEKLRSEAYVEIK